MDTGGSRDGTEGRGLVPRERADEICAAWGVPPIEAEVVSEVALQRHLSRELGLDCRTGSRGRQCGELVARLLDHLEQKEQGSEDH